MASAELKELVELAKEARLEGTELYNFLRDERENGECEREEKEREQEERGVNGNTNEREREEKGREREAAIRHEVELTRLKPLSQ